MPRILWLKHISAAFYIGFKTDYLSLVMEKRSHMPPLIFSMARGPMLKPKSTTSQI